MPPPGASVSTEPRLPADASSNRLTRGDATEAFRFCFRQANGCRCLAIYCLCEQNTISFDLKIR